MAEKNVSVGGRGTSRRAIKKDDKTSSGPAFSSLGSKQKAQSANMYVSVGRGTSKIKFGDIATTPKKVVDKKPGKGRWVRAGRGVGKIWVK